MVAKHRLDIAIASAGRFHLLDLARELHRQGHAVRFYSFVPRVRARQFGLPDQCHVSLLPFVAPALACGVLVPRLRERMMWRALDRAVSFRLRRCDVFIGMSGIYLEAARIARRRYRARIWLERGSRHILSQDAILADVPGAERPSPMAMARELAGYELADRIVIPSRHVEESFDCDPSARDKLFRNPYGTDLAMFTETPRPPPGGTLNALFVGEWSLRKGCDLIVRAVSQMDDVSLTHVGRLGALPFPSDNNRFHHKAAVDQAELARDYAAADVLILASREEGLSLVLAQALASGLPVICTDRTGGADLAHTPNVAARIALVPHDDADALRAALEAWRVRLRSQGGLPRLDESDRAALGWAAYGRRYSDELKRDVGNSAHAIAHG